MASLRPNVEFTSDSVSAMPDFPAPFRSLIAVEGKSTFRSIDLENQDEKTAHPLINGVTLSTVLGPCTKKHPIFRCGV